MQYDLPADVTVSRATITLMTTLSRVIRSIELSNLDPSGKLTYDCGLIDRPGSYVFTLANASDGQVLVTSRALVARWSKVTLTLPREFETLAGAVALRFEVSDTQSCQAQDVSVLYSIQLRRYDDVSQYNVAYNFTSHDFTQFDDSSISVPCTAIDEAGDYQMFLTSSTAPDNPLATSNVMDVTWSPAYAVSAVARSVFPCAAGGFVVNYAQPQCPGTEDKIRLYEQILQYDTDVSGLTSRRFVTERRAVKRQWTVEFDCDVFDIDAHGYCFEYWSYTHDNKNHQQDQICVQTRDLPG